MTGMGSDGTDGATALRRAGAAVIAQDEPSSTVWGMPGSVVFPAMRVLAAVITPETRVVPEPLRDVVAPSSTVKPSWSFLRSMAFWAREPILAKALLLMRRRTRSVMTVWMPMTVGVIWNRVSVIC